MKEQRQKVPVLRFPGFGEEWKTKELSEVNTKMQSGLSRLLKDKDIGLPVIRSNNIYNGQLSVTDIKYWYIDDPQGANTENYFLEEGDLLINFINSVAQIGKVAFYDSNKLGRDAILTTNIMRLQFEDEVYPKFVFYFCATTHYKAHIHSITKPAVNQASFTTKDLGRLRLALPPLKEQQKIAAFLSAVDTKIEQLGKKKALLEQYKKGMMQKLFSQELRFKDEQGNDYPDWEEKRLGETYKWIRTNNLSRARLSYDGGAIQNIHYGDIHTKFQSNFRQSLERVPFITGVKVEDYNEDDRCRLGDAVIADASEDYADIGKAIEIIELSETPLVAGLHTYIARPTPGTLIVGFSGYLLRSAEVRKQIKRIAQGISVLGISKGNLEKLYLQIPHSLEQQKITDILSAIDNKIELVATELEQAQTFKKGLLQQMFV